ncbi:hypothetical protein D3C87_1156440 [compost metagenome]
MRQSLLSALIAAPVFLAACVGPSSVSNGPLEPTQPLPPDYFPLVKGAEYKAKTYTYYFPDSESGEFTGYELTRVMLVDRSGDTATASFRAVTLSKEEKQVGSPVETRYSLKGGGLYQAHGGGEPMKQMDWPPLEGSYVLPASYVLDDFLRKNYEFSDISKTVTVGNSVTTEAGTFHDVILVTSISTDTYLGSTPTRTSTTSHRVWLAPNVGMVKGRTDKETQLTLGPSYSSSGFELATFSIPVVNP